MRPLSNDSKKSPESDASNKLKGENKDSSTTEIVPNHDLIV